MSQTCSEPLHGVQLYVGGGFPSASQLRVWLCPTPTTYWVGKLTILAGSVYKIRNRYKI